MWTGAVALLMLVLARAGGKRIVGGKEADIAALPFLTSLQHRGGSHCCVANIVTLRWLLTAAHCVHFRSSTDPTDYVVVAGVSKMLPARYLREGQRGWPDRFVVHPLFRESHSYDYDLAMMRLREPLVETQLVRRVALPADIVADARLYKGSCTVAGWGYTRQVEARRMGPQPLLKVSLPLVDVDTCAQMLNVTVRPFVHLCTHAPDKDACHGDSGAALVCHGVQVGVVSWGHGCANEYPGVYARVDTQMAWLHQVVSGAPLRRPAPALLTYCLVAAIFFLT